MLSDATSPFPPRTHQQEAERLGFPGGTHRRTHIPSEVVHVYRQNTLVKEKAFSSFEPQGSGLDVAVVTAVVTSATFYHHRHPRQHHHR